MSTKKKETVAECDKQPRYGLTAERYEQMAQIYSDEEIEEIVAEAGVEDLNRGYAIDCGRSVGDIELLEICRVSAAEAFEDDEAAGVQAAKDGYCNIIPIEELPSNFDMRWFGWVDTTENRKNIERYCAQYCS